MKGSWLNSNPYLSGCKARDPVPEISAPNSLLMNSLLLPISKSQDKINQLQQETNITRMYVYAPVLKKLILVSVAWVTSQYFYSSLDGMLDLRNVTPPPAQH